MSASVERITPQVDTTPRTAESATQGLPGGHAEPVSTWRERLGNVLCSAAVLGMGVAYTVIGAVPLDFLSDNQPGPGFFPTLIGVVLTGIGLADVVVETRKMYRREPLQSVDMEGVEVPGHVEPGLSRDTWLFALATIAYCVVFFYTGVVIATVLFAIAATFLLERQRRLKTMAFMLPFVLAMIVVLDLLVQGAMGVV